MASARIRMIAFTALTSLALGCSAGVAESVRTYTYPPDFNYISSTKIKSAMWQLASQVSQLDALIRDGSRPPESQRSRAIELIKAMERTSLSLGPTGWPANHPRVSRRVGGFRQELAVARRALEEEPPSYFYAGSVSGACMHCHGPGSK